MLKQRILTALVLVAVLLVTLFAADSIYWRAFISLILLLGFWEWLRFCEIDKPLAKVIGWILFVASLASLLLGYVPLQLSIYVACALWLGLLSFTVLSWFQFLHHSLLKALVGILIIPLAGWYVIQLKELEHGPLWVICFLVAVFAADIGAFFVGRRFGRTKLAPNISPGKTVEGLLGGVAFVLVLFVPTLYINFSATTATGLLLTIIITALISVGGDLFESKLKRHVNLKDSSNILPGHGGILDRIDSLLSAAPFFMLGLWLLGYLN